ncbi:Spliceosome associated proteinlike [Caligus rogercresseyi]|uniref:Spliceosome associated proteinlike n=1 Tax=Caligus rogercresseyi TaxID=217165 RepID=A0A7T8GZS4_CALRO|nr:Spliceosome associated proteinlike [Caligus rogercresseyi]|eukprot:TRINITY_DN6390_c0_g1_i1.p1 TRINITY_DN6390_c0_g1~~TRINITY_DN6390_c0_g1_i1.p1  ORF type:complete len:732 (+),score=270.67 TRINITY_DN6390_c0_g1_i1:44-2239(+)
MPPTDDSSSNGVGIIYPPPEVRNIVDKTASFVARNGPDFEQKIKQNEINNPKFNFLNSGDPYNAYYQYKVNDIRASEEEKSSSSSSVGRESAPPVSTAPKSNSSAPDAIVKQRQQDILNQALKNKEHKEEYVPKEAPPEFEFIADPPSISAFDLDVVKLTAQFVARNGRQFLTNLMNREQRNYQFDFLRPQHSLFQYFTKLLEQYTKVLIPPKDLLRKLREEDENVVKEQIRDRVAWIRHVEAKKRREEEQAERERVSYAQVDWHNFVVVETVDYQAWETGNFPPPTNMEEVGARVLMQRRVESSGDKPREGANTTVQDMDEESSSSEEEEEEEDGSVMGSAPAGIGKPLIAVDAAPAVRQPSLPTPGNVEVRQYDPKQQGSKKKSGSEAAEEYLVSPITGERIHASKVQEHMRIGLLDPRWVEERDKQLSAKASEEQVFAPGQSIENSLKHLAERRTDIFGVGEEAAQETAIGKKIGEEEDRNRLGEAEKWDGHSSSAEAASRAARANFTINEQIEQIHRNKGLIPDAKKDMGGSNKPVGVMSKPVPPPPSKLQQPMMPPSYGLHGMVPAPVQPPPPPQMVPPMMPPSVLVAPQSFYMPSQAPMFNQPPPMEPDEPPPAKKPKEDTFLPEGEWMKRFSGPMHIRIKLPNMPEKQPEWQLSGQTLSLTLLLSDSVAVLKGKLTERIGMPAGKQKLQMGNTFFKDSNSLAFYNISPNSVINLQVKERGGRKK